MGIYIYSEGIAKFLAYKDNVDPTSYSTNFPFLLISPLSYIACFNGSMCVFTGDRLALLVVHIF